MSIDIAEHAPVRKRGLDNPHEVRSPGRSKRSRSRREANQALIAVVFLLPNLLGFLAFTFFPVLFSFWMAFTNWSLKPAVKFQYVGLRNFTDMLGATPIGAGSPGLLAVYVICAVATIAALIGALWVNMSQVRGVRLGGAVLLLTGLAFLEQGIASGAQGVAIGGVIAVLCGVLVASREGRWAPGLGTLPSILLAASTGTLWGLRAPMGHAYAPSDGDFWQFFYNTVYLMLGIPFSIAGSLILALLLNEDLPTGAKRQKALGAATCVVLGLISGGLVWVLGSPNAGLLCGLFWAIAALGFAFNVVAFRTLFYLPTFTAGVALMILWKALYNPQTGPIDLGIGALYHLLHINAAPPQWLGDVNWAKPALIIMSVWTCIGGTNMLLYLAGLSNLPKELLDAADVDGAGRWHRFVHVIWPQLAPTTFFITIMSIIGGLQGGFDQARVMTDGGPAGSTTTLAYYIYTKAFQDLDMGYAAAISWVLFLVVFVATALNWKFGKGLETE